VLPDIDEQILNRFDRIGQSLSGFGSLLGSLDRNNFSIPELAAFAYLIESVYTEIEHVFKLIERAFSGYTLSKTETWHRDLLKSMTSPNEKRKQVLSQDTSDSLNDLLQFRHFARYSTAPVLSWEKMRPLLKGLEATVDRTKKEIENFLSSAQH
jgi:hypothetical protein